MAENFGVGFVEDSAYAFEVSDRIGGIAATDEQIASEEEGAVVGRIVAKHLLKDCFAVFEPSLCAGELGEEDPGRQIIGNLSSDLLGDLFGFRGRPGLQFEIGVGDPARRSPGREIRGLLQGSISFGKVTSRKIEISQDHLRASGPWVEG